MSSVSRDWIRLVPFALYVMPQLTTLLVIGAPGYRTDFCSRRIVFLYHYVWLMMLTIQLLITLVMWQLKPSIEKMKWKVVSLVKRDDTEQTTDEKEQTTDQAASIIRSQLVGFELSVLTAGVVFGLWCPVMLIWTPLVIWHQLLACKELQTEVAPSIGMIVARAILVHKPWWTHYVRVLGICCVTVFTMFDYEFDIEPQIAFVVSSMLVWILAYLLKLHESKLDFLTIPVSMEEHLSKLRETSIPRLELVGNPVDTSFVLRCLDAMPNLEQVGDPINGTPRLELMGDEPVVGIPIANVELVEDDQVGSCNSALCCGEVQESEGQQDRLDGPPARLHDSTGQHRTASQEL